MTSDKLRRSKSIAQDIVLALLIFLLFVLVTMSPTIGNTSFYNNFVSDGSITTMLQKELKEKTNKIAEQTGLDPLAFDSAVGQNRISYAQTEMVKSAFSGANYDYSGSHSIEECYYNGIKEHYRQYELELDETALEKAVPLACDAFNETLGIDNNKEFSRFAKFLSKYSMYAAIILLVLIVLMSFRIYNYSHGRTKVWSHFGCSFISSGLALFLLFIANALFRLSDNMYFTDNEALNYVLSSAAGVYFLILGGFGIAFMIAGYSLIGYVRRYYTRKSAKNKQESDINKTLLVRQVDGDKTVQELVDNRRKQQINENMTNDKETK